MLLKRDGESIKQVYNVGVLFKSGINGKVLYECEVHCMPLKHQSPPVAISTHLHLIECLWKGYLIILKRGKNLIRNILESPPSGILRIYNARLEARASSGIYLENELK